MKVAEGGEGEGGSLPPLSINRCSRVEQVPLHEMAGVIYRYVKKVEG